MTSDSADGKDSPPDLDDQTEAARSDTTNGQHDFADPSQITAGEEVDLPGEGAISIAAAPGLIATPGVARTPSVRDLRRLLGDEFAGFGLRALAIGAIGGLAAVIELVIVFAIANLGSALLRADGDVPIELAFGLHGSRTQIATLALVAVAVRGVVDVLFVSAQTRALTRYEIDARATLLDAFLAAEWLAQSHEPPAQFVNTTYAFLATCRTAYRRVMDLVTALISFLIMVAGSFLAGGPSAIGIIAGSALIAAALRPIVRRSHGAGRDARDAAHRFGDAMWESVLLARETRVLGLTAKVSEKNARAAEAVAMANKNRDYLSGLAGSAYSSALYGVITFGLLLIVLLDVSDPTRIVVVLLLLYRGLGYGRTFQAMYQEVVTAEPSIRSLRQTRERLQASAMPAGHVTLDDPVRDINFDRVGFAYDEREPALHDVTLRLGEGDALGVVGPSGAGKSTFVHLLLRLLSPSNGTVSVNGTNLRDIDPSSWFGRVVLVPQDARTYEGTVFDNVACGRPGIGVDEVREALRSAHLLSEVEALPEGVDTFVTGDRLSGGQRQRLAIARALAGRPDVLVLDEPTSALDLISEEAIRQTLEGLRGRMTLVIVAHRLSTLRICDRVAVFDRGTIEAIGTRSDLAEGSAFYAEALRLARLV